MPQEVTLLSKYTLALTLLSIAALFVIGVAFAHARQRSAAHINELRELSIFSQFQSESAVAAFLLVDNLLCCRMSLRC